VSNCRNFEVVGAKGRGRSKKTWDECVRQDLKSLDSREYGRVDLPFRDRLA